MSDLRQEFMEILSFPRLMALGSVDPDNCPQSGHFVGESEHCVHCEFASECEWLGSNESFMALARKPVESLVADLNFAIDYIEAVSRRAEHRPRSCMCDSCRWLARAQQLLNKARGKSEIVPSG